MTILLFRPKDKLGKSAIAFQQAGLSVNCVALQQSEKQPTQLAHCLETLNQSQPGSVVIVTSTFAAQLLAEHAERFPSGLKVLAVGQSTAEVIGRFCADVQVAQPQSSEGVLAHPLVAEASPVPLIIVKGVGGRDLISKTLRSASRNFAEFDVYRRRDLPSPISQQPWYPENIHCIIVTSGEQLSLAFKHYDPNWLKSLPWLVASQRQKEIATTLGITRVWVSAGARDEQLIASIEDNFGVLND